MAGHLLPQARRFDLMGEGCQSFHYVPIGIFLPGRITNPNQPMSISFTMLLDLVLLCIIAIPFMTYRAVELPATSAGRLLNKRHFEVSAS